MSHHRACWPRSSERWPSAGSFWPPTRQAQRVLNDMITEADRDVAVRLGRERTRDFLRRWAANEFLSPAEELVWTG